MEIKNKHKMKPRKWLKYGIFAGLAIAIVVLATMSSGVLLTGDIGSVSGSVPKYTRILRLSSPMMRGSDILHVQKQLNKMGYTEVGKLDGIFGSNTKKAVVSFQKKNFLKADGIVGKTTWNRLFSGYAIRSGNSPYTYDECKRFKEFYVRGTYSSTVGYNGQPINFCKQKYASFWNAMPSLADCKWLASLNAATLSAEINRHAISSQDVTYCRSAYSNLWPRQSSPSDPPLYRAEFAKMLVDALKFPLVTATGNVFDDVDANDWYAPYVETLAARGLIQTSSPSFLPMGQINRAEVIKMVVEASELNLARSINATTCSDVTGFTTRWYAVYFQTARDNNIFTETECRPADNATRSEVSEIIRRITR